MRYEFNKARHLHLLNGRPLTGTSSIGNVLAKPALINWAANMAVGYIESEVSQIMADKDNWVSTLGDKWFDILQEAKVAHRKKKESAAVKGTDLHAELEDYVKAMMKLKPVREYDKKIQPFIDWSDENVKQFLASEAHCYDEDLWVGGITDAVAELNDGKMAIIDFKSSKAVYITHLIQAAGYAIQTDKNGLFSEDGEHSKKLDKPIDTLIVVAFGAKEIVPEIKYNIEDYKAGFRHAVGLYRLMGLDK